MESWDSLAPTPPTHMNAASPLWASLNHECRCIHVEVETVRRWVERELIEQGVQDPIVSTHPHLFASVPVFVDASHLRQAYEVIDGVNSVVARVEYQNAVLASTPDIAAIDHGASGVLVGYDFHLSADGVDLIEINSNAGGALLNTLLHRAQRACCADQRGADEAAALQRMLGAMFQQEWRLARPGAAPPQRIAIVDDDPERQYLYSEFVLFKKLFEARGWEALIVDAGELQFDGRRLTHGGRPIDLVYNRLTDFYLEHPEHSQLRDAHRANAVVLTPHPRNHALYANKRNLVLLSDAAALQSFGVAQHEAAVLLRSIPVTRVVSRAEHDRWWSERKQWFFKPASGFAGRGAYRGDKLTRRAFEDVMSGDYVAQRVVSPAERVAPSGGALRWDLRVYVYQGAPLFEAARLYAGQTTNFRTPDGGFAPVLVGGGCRVRRTQTSGRG